ncbi:hypothetical protein BOX15_Mlig009820g1 [Macrostomum lignano]|uniref:J domain-containing protein n=1 Tax=Macrostomum lignano TaxID=282301 RepID=A0A267D9R3_9PLAT|nr:hypothetical protein BOX15_Mlig009820g2 [Macrostomum lignano]PAA73642.1 hypothetical protein BOX15_Mlig009820g1 [Macrostomum lignano]
MASASNASGSEPPNSERKFSTSGDSLYQILGLEKGASPEQVKKAYRKLALQYHPDKNPDPSAADKIKELNRANHVLSDEKRKAIYDKYGSVGLQIASQIGEDNVTTYFMLDNVCCKILLVACFALTCCCFCCCCCCCCGKCVPKETDDEGDYAYYQPEATGAESTVTSQPQGSADDATERTRLKSDEQATYNQ